MIPWDRERFMYARDRAGARDEVLATLIISSELSLSHTHFRQVVEVVVACLGAGGMTL